LRGEGVEGDKLTPGHVLHGVGHSERRVEECGTPQELTLEGGEFRNTSAYLYSVGGRDRCIVSHPWNVGDGVDERHTEREL